ncbi:helix-turn-helix domain-containing protein [Paenibacillus sp. UASWS1643]|uniref:helix-turn-helix domain-containing protein n=1 Tax=Paenibacillus sp. UASWS1643 TaxID=2580422 RepID=UPI00123B1036|nr:helix-turn-helix domain-containing protein [Paenibacillus sp. UASWS1643]KAA8745392.1 helix-turn-helix domain-containing protein [Paenibacillus sp. UASWS1643]
MGLVQGDEFIHTSCKLLLESLQLPVSYSRMDDEEVRCFLVEGTPNNPLFDNHSELVRLLKKQVQPLNVPNIHTTNFGESLIIVPKLRDEAMEAIVVIGPFTVIPMNNENINNLLTEFNYTVTPEWTSYLQQLPLLSSKRLNYIGILVHHLLNGIMLDITEIMEKHFRFEQQFHSSKHAEIVISDRRESLEFRGLFEIERQLLRSIRNGDKAAFYNMTILANHDGPGILSNYNQLRSIKNLGIYVIALATRAAIEGGLYAEVAYILSDLHIQHIEDLREYSMVVSAIGDALIDFVDRVSNNKRKNISKSIATCQEYIFNHLYDNIPLSVLADKAGLQENYLSQLFKKETGVTITQFIQQEKVEEAKKMLELTSERVTAIAAKLNFYDQNHFIKIFKRYTGLTPKRYRNKNKFDTINDD